MVRIVFLTDVVGKIHNEEMKDNKKLAHMKRSDSDYAEKATEGTDS